MWTFFFWHWIYICHKTFQFRLIIDTIWKEWQHRLVDASGYALLCSCSPLLGVAGTLCFPIEAQFYILGGMHVRWRQHLFWGNASQTTPTVSFFNSLDCLGHNLESSALTSPLKKLKMLTMDTYVMPPETACPPLTTEVNLPLWISLLLNY